MGRALCIVIYFLVTTKGNNLRSICMAALALMCPVSVNAAILDMCWYLLVCTWSCHVKKKKTTTNKPPPSSIIHVQQVGNLDSLTCS